MSVIALLSLGASGLVIALAVFVLFRHRRRPINQIYFVFCCCLVGWMLGIYNLLSGTSAEAAAYWVHICQYGMIFGPLMFLQLVVMLFDLPRKRFLVPTYIAAALLTAGAYRNFMLQGVRATALDSPGSSWSTVGGTWGAVTAGYVLLMAILTLSLLVTVSRPSSGRRRAQARYLFVAQGLAVIGGVHDFAALVGMQTYPGTAITIYPLGTLAMVGWATIPAYTLLRYQLIDLDVAFTRTIANLLVLLLLMVSCFAVLLEAQRAYFGFVQPEFSLITFGVFVAATFFFPRVKVVAQENIENALFSGEQDYQSALYALTQESTRILNLNTLTERVADTLTSTHGVSAASVYIEDGKGRFRLGALRGKYEREAPASFEPSDPIVAWLHDYKAPLVREELELYDTDEAARCAKRMRDLGADVGVPLTTSDMFVGIILLGPKETAGMFSVEDIQRLSILANHVAAAILNARLYRDLTRSQEVIAQSDRLSAIGTMAAVLAHEIRNPLVSIRTFTQLLPERYDDEEFRSSFLDLTLSEVDRISGLINELLTFARPAPAALVDIDLNACIDRISRLLETQAKNKGVTLRLDLAEHVPTVTADEDQIKQVIMNIVMNAIESCNDNGQVTVRSAETFTHGTSYVRIEVRDNGCGIDTEHLDHIFDPFFTTRKEGTGLGLSIAHQIVTKHGGFMDVSSKRGVGTSFFIHIPQESPALPAPAAEAEEVGLHG